MTQRLRAALLSGVLAAAVLLSWSTRLDVAVRDETAVALERALIAFATARALNSVISAAQGTELALQPAGIGVTLTPGEILDPLNDLIERFSWLVLLAASSLGVQVLLTEIFAQPWASVLISVTAGAYLALLWWRPEATDVLRKLTLAALFLRFFVVLVTFASTWIGEHFLSERQQLAIDTITLTTAELETVDTGDDESWLTQMRDTLDIKKQIEAFKSTVEIAISFLLDLIVTFVLQTLVFPLASALLGYWVVRWVWRRA